jgi:lipopolysaccharide biosynthesis protein
MELRPVNRRKFRRAYLRLTSHIVPHALAKLGYKRPPPKGRERRAEQDYSMAVPFQYASHPRIDRPPVAVICHLFHPDLSDWLVQILSQLELSAHVYVSTDTAQKAELITEVLSRWTAGEATVRIAENRGRDIAPKLVTFADVYDRHEIVLFLHSKKSSHYAFGEAWRDYLVQCLAGSPSTVGSIMEIFDKRPDVGMVIPQHFQPLRDETTIDWASNYRMAERLAWRMDFDLYPDGYVDLPSGSMFWARSAALRPLLDLKLSMDAFPPELGQLDMTIAHGIERLFLFVCERAGFTWVKVMDATTAAESDPTVTTVHEASGIDAFIAQYRFDLLERRP